MKAAAKKAAKPRARLPKPPTTPAQDYIMERSIRETETRRHVDSIADECANKTGTDRSYRMSLPALMYEATVGGETGAPVAGILDLAITQLDALAAIDTGAVYHDTVPRLLANLQRTLAVARELASRGAAKPDSQRMAAARAEMRRINEAAEARATK